MGEGGAFALEKIITIFCECVAITLVKFHYGDKARKKDITIFSFVYSTTSPLYLCSRHDYLTFCTSGYRAAIASSVLKRAGFKVRDIRGGFAAISVYASDLTTSEKVSYHDNIIMLPRYIELM